MVTIYSFNCYGNSRVKTQGIVTLDIIALLPNLKVYDRNYKLIGDDIRAIQKGEYIVTFHTDKGEKNELNIYI